MPTVTLANDESTFSCAEDDTVLRAALRAGLGMGYECNVGSCGSCRFELLEGAVEHVGIAPPPAWSVERDLPRNRYLACQARPLGDIRIKAVLRDSFKSQCLPTRHPAVFLGSSPVTHDIREFRFSVPAHATFLPGQYALLEIPGVPGAVRAYSMANVTGDAHEWHFHVRRVATGRVSSYLFEHLEPGTAVQLDGPYGMAYLREDAPRDILCLAGGSGLAPMLSITRAAVRSEALRGRNIHFFYGGRSPRDICGESFLKDLPGFGERVHYHCAVSEPSEGWTGRTGMVHELALEMFGERLKEFEIYFAGPPPMAEAIQRMAVRSRVPMTQVHFDKFY